MMMLARRSNGEINWKLAEAEVWQYCLENPGAYARDIANHFGIERNAVIGYWNRLSPEKKAQREALRIGKLPSKGRLTFDTPRIEKPKPEPKPLVVYRVQEVALPQDSFPSIQIPDRGCRWIDGEVGKGAVYCGAPIHNRAFCAEHAARAYVPVDNMKEERRLLRAHG